MDQFPKVYRVFHPTEPAYGTRNYDVGALTNEQKQDLHLRKALQRRENEIYLRKYPEIKGLISILLRHLLKEKPTIEIQEAVGRFFNRQRGQIITDVLDYFTGIDGLTTDIEYRLRRMMLTR